MLTDNPRSQRSRALLNGVGNCALLLLGSTLLAPVAVWAKCQLRIVELPVTMSGLRALATVRINDRDLDFMVDSGAFYSMLTPATAEELKLPHRRPPSGLRVRGVGGRAEVYSVRVERFALKRTEFSNVEFLVGGNELGGGAAGLLGQNFLGASDIEYDFANGVVRLVQPADECEKSPLAYWAGDRPVAEIDFSDPRAGRWAVTKGTARVNGEEMVILFDTGSPVSMLSLPSARRAGLVPGGQGVVATGLMTGVGRREVKTWIAPVQNFSIGSEQIHNTHLRFGDFVPDDFDMLIGMDFLLSHRVYVANSQGKIYFTYGGGPVFDLTAGSTPSRTEPSAEAATKADVEPLAALPTLGDAGAYARRGAALASRREFRPALEDLSRACELDPGVGRYFLMRGNVRLLVGQADPAMSDFTEAIRLEPDNVDARVARARLFAARKDVESARTDLLAADQAADSQAPIRLSIGNLYMTLDLPGAAVPQYDRWIAAHGEDVELPSAQNQRCWARALLGVELERALADCGAAVDSHPDSAHYLGDRGLVYLRMGDLNRALADYNAALRIDPRLAWALYGRGLVRLRQGALGEGEADIAAARAIRPSIDKEAREHGIERP